MFRLTRTTALPLFPTLSSSRALLLHFRFAAHSFLSTLSTHIYDTVIGGNFDAFLLRITACRETPDAPSGFRDVFALAECHSSVLDDILSGCLLRSSQRPAGDLLRGTLEVVLEFCVLVGDLKDGRKAEYQASPVLEALYASFRKKVSALVSRTVFAPMTFIDLTIRCGHWKLCWKGTGKVGDQDNFKLHIRNGSPGYHQVGWIRFGIS